MSRIGGLLTHAPEVAVLIGRAVCPAPPGTPSAGIGRERAECVTAGTPPACSGRAGLPSGAVRRALPPVTGAAPPSRGRAQGVAADAGQAPPGRRRRGERASSAGSTGGEQDHHVGAGQARPSRPRSLVAPVREGARRRGEAGASAPWTRGGGPRVSQSRPEQLAPFEVAAQRAATHRRRSCSWQISRLGARIGSPGGGVFAASQRCVHDRALRARLWPGPLPSWSAAGRDSDWLGGGGAGHRHGPNARRS